MKKNQVSDARRWLDKHESGTGTEKKIVGVVKEYIRLFPSEFEDFKGVMRQKKRKIDGVSNKFAQVQGSDIIERHLAEWPETLEMALRLQLHKDEYDWLRTTKGISWFLKKFPVFRITHSI